MRHPGEGVLRRLVDEPSGVADADRAHIAACPHCLGRLDVVRSDADVVASALSVHTGPSDVDDAWRRLATAPAERRAAVSRRGPRFSRPAIAAFAAAVVLAGAGTAAANNWLPIFRTQQVAPVGLSAADVMELPDLSDYGAFEVVRDGRVHSVPDAGTATEETGIAVPRPAGLPRGVSGEPEYRVGGKVTATFTFSAARAADAARAAGASAPVVPPGLDGSQVRLVAGPGVAVVHRGAEGMPVLVVGRAVAPTAYSTGAPFDVVRDHLLSIPGLPDDVAARLRSFTEDARTLPLPVPGDRVTTSTATVHGVPASVVASRDGAFAAVLWVRDGLVTAVAGAFDADEVLRIAEGVR